MSRLLFLSLLIIFGFQRMIIGSPSHVESLTNVIFKTKTSIPCYPFMKNQQILQASNILGLVLVLTLNTLAVTLPIAGRNTGEISDFYPNLFVPAGYAFSIWSIIYILLIIFVIIQAKGLFSSTKKAPDYVQNIGWWFVISCLFNASWILAWHYLLTALSVIIMLGILTSLIQIYLRLDIHYPSNKNPLLVRLPFSVYLGWITVATVANVTAFLVSIDWSGFGISPIYWTVIMILVAASVGVIAFWKRKDVAFVSVLIWALVAILVKRQNANVPEESMIITTIYIAIGFLILSALIRMFIKTKSNG